MKYNIYIMKIKIYKDNTYNIFFEKGDQVKIHHNDKYSEPNSKVGTWGSVISVTGKKLTSKVKFKDEKGEYHEEFSWNLIPVDDSGKKLPEKQLFELVPTNENFIVLKYDEFRFKRSY